MTNGGPFAVHRSSVEMLAVDAMVLADEIETYFAGDELAAALTTMSDGEHAAMGRVGLVMITRVKRLVDWLGSAEPHLDQPPQAADAEAPTWATADLARVTPEARVFAMATSELFDRLERMRDPARAAADMPSPARALQARLAARLGVLPD